MSAEECIINESERLATVAKCFELNATPNSAFDGITRAAARFCDAGLAAISLVDAKHVHYLSVSGVGIATMNRDIAFCAEAIIDPTEDLEVKDVLIDARFKHNPLVLGAPYIRYYYGIPLVTSRGHALGVLAIMDSQPRALTQQARQALTDLAGTVVSLLEQGLYNPEQLVNKVVHVPTNKAIKLEFFSVFDAIPSQIAVLDGKGTILHINKAWKDSVISNSADGQIVSTVGQNYLDICQSSGEGSAESTSNLMDAYTGLKAI